ncbi:probable disease resistance protein At1g15890 isoform X1 [Punica granatum]|uniref:Probable disease resistance protein At1g15890 isoform X1 n=1 Tax=Punica granatum TaxID=22663 RepID=A0A218XD88_PUNGR|nr:probable disease resistance protein At1g15890 isoform X1 [Punica granatum]OWM82903.1 hypothetical protein CDL15_Pgr005303 [Punica granatum]
MEIASAVTAVFSSVCQCWDCMSRKRMYIQNLRDNLTSLENKMNELNHVKGDVTRRVDMAEGEGWIRTSDIGGWLGRVEALNDEVSRILADGKQLMEKNCLCSCFPKNCRARYRQSEAAERKQNNVEAELGRGRNFEVVAYEPGDLILKRSLEAVRGKMEELGHVFEDVRERVRREEERHLIRTSEVGGWLERVELLKEEVGQILEKGRHEMEKNSVSVGVGGDPQSHSRNCPSYNQLSKHAEKKRTTLEEELGKARGFTILAYEPNDPLMVEIPLEPPVGLDSTFKEVWHWVSDERLRRIGLYGMGGVGKTTLLKKIHNEFLGIEHDYNVVAWIVVSRPTNPKKIQEAICEKLHLPKSEWDQTSELDRARKILIIMKRKSFLLFLDDLWEDIDLLNLGIPSHNHQHKSKIIFTTRSEEVCGLMQADRTKKVECLPQHKALELFREKVGEETWAAHVEIPKLAVSLVEECEYLPLALITVGAAMASRKHPDDWRRAINYLKNSPSDFAAMGERVLSVLEFSYEALPNETQKQCFLYCSIFPEDYKFEVDELTNLWMGQGFLSECHGFHEARDHGIDIIRYLIRVCLLEEVDMPIDKSFKMHDVVRDMALWVASEHGQKKNKILCQEKERSFEPKELLKWTDAEWISLWAVDQEMENFPITFTAFSRLSTLKLWRTQVETFPKGFFSSMPSLRVLDLSVNLRLAELPEDIGVLVNLRYLNLRLTEISKLPLELKNLIKLVFLILDRKCRVSKGLIPSPPSLRVFSWCWGLPLFVTSTEEIDEGEELNVIEELNDMNQIDDVCLQLIIAVAVQKLLAYCPHLQRCLRELGLRWCNGLRSLIIPKPSLRRMEHLEFLHLEDCEFAEISMVEGEYGCGGEIGRSDGSGSPLLSYPEISCLESKDCFGRLNTIQIWECNRLREVTVLIYHAPRLNHLEIWGCDSLR